MRNLIIRFREFLINVLHRLPVNGDFLFVTETPRREDVENVEDLALKYLDQEKIENEINRELDENVLKIIYEQALSFEKEYVSWSSNIRDKAKALLGTATFISAILIVVSSVFLPVLAKSPVGVQILEIVVLFFLFSHMIRSLFISLKVMTREHTVTISPGEIIELKGEVSGVYRKLISKIIAYANKSADYVRKRGNRLMIALHCFQWGLVYFFMLIVLHFISISLTKNKGEELGINNYLSKEVSILSKKNDTIFRTLEDIKSSLQSQKLINDSLNLRIDSISSMLRGKGFNPKGKK